MSYRYTIETENPIVTDGNKMYNCNDGKLRLKIVEANPWHTGTPVEDGWYLLECNIGNSDATYYVTDYWSNEVGYWTVNRVIRWQKIEKTD